MAQFVANFEDPAEAPPITKAETKEERSERVRDLKAEARKGKLEADIEAYDVTKDEKIKGDPYKTLFIARLSYDASDLAALLVPCH